VVFFRSLLSRPKGKNGNKLTNSQDDNPVNTEKICIFDRIASRAKRTYCNSSLVHPLSFVKISTFRPASLIRQQWNPRFAPVVITL
jgi:hypothetical protein